MTLLFRPSPSSKDAKFTTRRLAVESLEDRVNPVQIVFDFSYDTSGFFTHNAAAVSELQRAATNITSRLQTPLAAITPGGSNTWTAQTFDPRDPSQNIQINNLSVAANTLVVYVGSFSGAGTEAGMGGFGGYSGQGSSSWLSTLQNRGQGGNNFASWGGSIGFSSTTNWSYSASGPVAGKLDFYSVATHELGHLLGFGTSTQFSALIHQNYGTATFNGTNATAAHGGVAPSLSSDQGHYASGTLGNGVAVSMQPDISNGIRREFSNLDYAALADIGWSVQGITSTSTTTPTTSPIISSKKGTPITVSGTTDGSFQVYNVSNGGLTAATSPISAYSDFSGVVRTAVADVNGDGVPDIIVGAGPGGGSRITVYNGANGSKIADFMAYDAGFTGGVFVAAADFQHNGHPDIIISADQGGGPNIRIFSLQGSNPVLVSSFWGIQDPSFIGGTRLAVGDINADGTPDLVVAAGYTGGPRVAVFNGNSVLSGSPTRLVNDFYAFAPTLTDGTYVTVGDFNGDGFGDIAFGAGPGGGPRVQVISGQPLIRQGSQTAINNPLANFYVGDPNSTGGVRLAAADVDGDGATDLIASSGQGVQSQVWVYGGRSIKGGSTPTQIATGLIFGGAALADGVYVG